MQRRDRRSHAAGAASKKHALDAHQKHLAHLAAEHKAHLAHLKHIGKTPKKRGLALGDAVACCAAEALAASLRLSGLSVSDADVLALYRHTAGGPDAGASIWRTMEAASVFGLGGFRPVETASLLDEAWVSDRESSVGVLERNRQAVSVGEFQAASAEAGHALILGVELPGSHTVLATPDGWWSWGDLYDPAAFPDAVIEEAWWVAWR